MLCLRMCPGASWSKRIHPNESGGEVPNVHTFPLVDENNFQMRNKANQIIELDIQTLATKTILIF